MSMHIEKNDDDWDRQADAPMPVKSGRNGPGLGLIALGIVAVLAVVFVLQNSGKGEVRFLWMESEVRVWLAIVVSIVLGALLDRLGVMFWRRRKKARAQRDN